MWYKDEIPANADYFLDMLQEALGLDHIRVEKWELYGGTGWDTDDTDLHFAYHLTPPGIVDEKDVPVVLSMRRICGTRDAWAKINGKTRHLTAMGRDYLVKTMAEAIVREWGELNKINVEEEVKNVRNRA